MKKIILIAALAIGFSAGAQKKDSTAMIQITDTTALATWKDYQEFISQPWFGDMPVKYADQVREWWYRRLMLRSTDRQKKAP